jgi:hypothetical protein
MMNLMLPIHRVVFGRVEDSAQAATAPRKRPKRLGRVEREDESELGPGDEEFLRKVGFSGRVVREVGTGRMVLGGRLKCPKRPGRLGPDRIETDLVGVVVPCSMTLPNGLATVR